MPRPSRGPAEKSKNFKGAIARLFKELKVFHVWIGIAVVLAILSSILSISAPDRLSSLTDEITDGLVVDQKGMKEVTKKITAQVSQEKMQAALQSDALSLEEKRDLMMKLQTLDASNQMALLDQLTPHETEVFFPEITVKDQKISSKDQVKYLHILSTLDMESGKKVDVNKLYKKVDKMPKSIQNIIKPRMDFKAIKSIALILIVLYVSSALASFIQTLIMATVSNSFAKSLRSRVSEKIHRLPLAYFDRNQTGDILSRVSNDIDTIAQSMNQSLGALVSSTALFIGTLIMMFVTNWIMALTAVGASLIGFIFMMIVMKRSQKYFRLRQQSLGALNGHIEEVYSGLLVVKAYNAKKESDEKFDALNQEVYQANRKSQFLSGLMMPMMNFIGNFGYAAVCIVGAVLTMNDVITFGVIVAFMTYVRLFTSPLGQIAQAITSLQSTAAASERVFELFDEPEMEKENQVVELDKDQVKGNISFKHVNFGYLSNQTIIHDFNADVKPGQKIAIVGPTGAGKTTMVNLLMKFYNIEHGDILIDGHSIHECTREQVHNMFTMVLQDTWLFNGTVRENIAFNHPNVTDQRIWDVCDQIGLSHYIHSLPNGLDTVLSDENSVSVGQRQLLTIARAMVEEKPFLILDEATSNVDTRTEELVQKAMDVLMKGKTSFVIAHRLSTIRNADCILVMNQGDIIEQGNHDALMQENGFYANLYNSQFAL